MNDALKAQGVNAINISGCPPNPYNLVGAIVAYLQGKKIELDDYNRPTMFFGDSIHDKCPRLKYFENDQFAKSFGDEGAKKGYCLYKLGCKGPETYANCPTVLFGDAGAGTWPVGCGHPCIGCTEEGVGFSKPIHMLAKVKNVEPPALYPAIHEPQGQGATLGSAAVLAAVAGAAAGAGAMFARNLGKQHAAADTAAKPAQREDA